jgi:hypothetical protein
MLLREALLLSLRGLFLVMLLLLFVALFIAAVLAVLLVLLLLVFLVPTMGSLAEAGQSVQRSLLKTA